MHNKHGTRKILLWTKPDGLFLEISKCFDKFKHCLSKYAWRKVVSAHARYTEGKGKYAVVTAVSDSTAKERVVVFFFSPASRHVEVRDPLLHRAVKFS